MNPWPVLEADFMLSPPGSMPRTDCAVVVLVRPVVVASSDRFMKRAALPLNVVGDTGVALTLNVLTLPVPAGAGANAVVPVRNCGDATIKGVKALVAGLTIFPLIFKGFPNWTLFLLGAGLKLKFSFLAEPLRPSSSSRLADTTAREGVN